MEDRFERLKGYIWNRRNIQQGFLAQMALEHPEGLANLPEYQETSEQFKLLDHLLDKAEEIENEE